MKIFWFTLFTIVFLNFIGCAGRSNQPVAFISSEVELHIETGENWQWERRVLLFTINVTPQFAAWIEDNNGNYISTITVTNWISSNFQRNTLMCRRPETLPVWNHKIQSNSTQEEIDAVSSATPKEHVKLSINNGLLNNGHEYNVYFEVNCSYDFNEFWTESNSGVNGQPSIIYHAKIIAGSTGRIDLVPIGHGSVDGSNGIINYELENISTALRMVKNVSVIIN